MSIKSEATPTVPDQSDEIQRPVHRCKARRYKCRVLELLVGLAKILRYLGLQMRNRIDEFT